MNDPVFIEVGHSQFCKNGNAVCGDSFVCKRNNAECRIVCVLADGLGSGIKASVLSQLTATMVARCVTNDLDIKQTARTIMETLPVCAVRKIGYATFTIIDIDLNGHASIIEFDNPGFLWVKNGVVSRPQRQIESVTTADGRRMELRFSQLVLTPQDRLIVFSDGVSQAGMGNDAYPLGWTQQGVEDFCVRSVSQKPDMSAQELSDALIGRALTIDSKKAKDDITAGVIYMRKPRELLLVTGAPFDRRRDREIAERCAGFTGTKVVCGGTTGAIIARELGKTLCIQMDGDHSEVPPGSFMDGIDLVTEGTITLSRLCAYLEGDMTWVYKKNPAAELYRLLMASDKIMFLVGTSVNEAHQDPSLPEDLDIRRNTVRRICKLLEETYLKTTSLRFL